jgi:hypothetical protein
MTDNIPEQTNSLPPWQHVLHFIRHHRRFFGFMLFLLILEGSMSVFLPRVVPDTLYLRAFLSWESVHQTRRFLSGQRTIEVDKQLGWHNRPDSNFQKIYYDQWGSRSHLGIQAEKRKTQRILFFGDSRINGHLDLKNTETINAYIDDEETETLNFASALYRLDQNYLALQSKQAQFQADVAVIGIDGRLGSLLDCHYLPFHTRSNTTLLKPRFELQSGQLIAKIPPFYQLLEDLPDNPALLDFLEKEDPCYVKFQYYKTWQSTPLLSILHNGQTLLSKVLKKFSMEKKESSYGGDLMVGLALLKAIAQFRQTHNIKVIFVLLPTQVEWTGALSDKSYQRTRQALEMENLPFIDVLTLLQQTTLKTDDIFTDSVHFTARTNQLIAQALQKHLAKQE